MDLTKFMDLFCRLDCRLYKRCQPAGKPTARRWASHLSPKPGECIEYAGRSCAALRQIAVDKPIDRRDNGDRTILWASCLIYRVVTARGMEREMSHQPSPNTCHVHAGVLGIKEMNQ